ncbi:hypothetical protein TNCV_4716251 [Trichonephila clavipes]|nr:hypothetical protein TNCV_4716251 [Trichonephila clavipes]
MIWWNNLKDLPMWPRRKTVAEFCLATGHDCLLKHHHRIHVSQVPFCTLCGTWEDMDDNFIHRCPVQRAPLYAMLIGKLGTYWVHRPFSSLCYFLL